jgi:hypothetical protein
MTCERLDRDYCMHIQHLCIANEVRCLKGLGLCPFIRSIYIYTHTHTASIKFWADGRRG